MSKQHPLWERVGQKVVYQGRAQIIKYEAILPNGEHTTYEVEHSDGKAVAVLIKTPENKIVLTHQFRFPLNRWIYDLPGGGSPAGEDLEAAAIRECQEEVGLAPKSIEKLNMFYPNPGRTDWPAYVFYCEDFESSKLEINDPSENVESVLMPVKEFKS
ncbi:MAG TPA: NUDIX hydrolase [Candidatus Saccharimonadales bacterium]|nr:NUDIX hydrolase [Candidatus Saccharimonadales bacterium]